MGTGLEEKIIKPGNRIEIQLERSGQKKENAVVYASQITDVYPDGKIEAYMPIDHGRLVLFSPGDKLKAYFYSAANLYGGSAVVTERYKTDGLYYMRLQMTSELKKNQRREYYRYCCMLQMEDRIVDATELQWMEENGKKKPFAGLLMDDSTMLDISGGGLQFLADHQYEEGSIVYCRFFFGKEYRQCIKILGVAVVEDRQNQYRYRARFIGMEKREREEIIQHIFELERMKRKSN